VNAGVVASIVELPVVLAGDAAVLSSLPVGWIVIIAYTFYRAWQSNDPRTSNIDLDVFQITGGVALSLYLVSSCCFRSSAERLMRNFLIWS
jgi:hypothetical protein